MKIDIGRLTSEQTAELLKECATALQDELFVKAVCEHVRGNDSLREELLSWLEDPSADLSALSN